MCKYLILSSNSTDFLKLFPFSNRIAFYYPKYMLRASRYCQHFDFIGFWIDFIKISYTPTVFFLFLNLPLLPFISHKRRIYELLTTTLNWTFSFEIRSYWYNITFSSTSLQSSFSSSSTSDITFIFYYCFSRYTRVIWTVSDLNLTMSALVNES